MVRFLIPDESALSYLTVVHPAVGPLSVAVDARGAVVTVEFGAGRVDTPSLAPLKERLTRYFAGEDHGVEICVAPRGLTAMQQSVLKAIAEIQSGCVSSYSAVAQSAGYPTSVRAVATAVGRNPVPVLVPCHRVLPVAAARRWDTAAESLLDNPGELGHFTPCDSLKPLLLRHDSTLKKLKKRVF